MITVEKITKFLMVIFMGLLLMLQFLSFPGQFRYMAEQEPETAYLRWPLTVLVFLIIFAIQVCIICLWKIIDNLFEKGQVQFQIKYINISIAALSFIWITIALSWIILILNADDPGLPVVVTVLECGVTLVLLLYLVFRKLILKNLKI